MVQPSLEAEGVKLFKLIRGKDESGVSGNGYVAYGMISHTGHVILCWRTDKLITSKVKVSSIAYYNSLKEFMDVHVNSHKDNNDTEIEWIKLVEC